MLRLSDLRLMLPNSALVLHAMLPSHKEQPAYAAMVSWLLNGRTETVLVPNARNALEDV